MSGRYDYIVIGSGPAGHVSAIKAAQAGLKVAVVEKDAEMLGGVCLNEGCIPAKSLYYSTKIFDLIKKGPEICGLEVACKSVDMPGFVRKSREAASQLRKGLEYLFNKNKIDLIHGKAEFTGRETVKITLHDGGDAEMEAGRYLIAAGSSPRELPGIPFDGEYVINSSQAIRLEKAPEKILIVGAGAIGTEFASFFSLIGTKVTLLEMEDHILPGEDNEVSKALESVFRRKGITVLTSSTLLEASGSDGSVTVKISRKGEEDVGDYNVILAAIGRKPSTSGLGLDKAGVETDDKGFIPVDGNMKTSAKNIYAAGDVLSTPMLAHVASAEGEAAADSLTGSDDGELDYSSIPNAVYSQVQVASVGMTEREAKQKGVKYSVGKQYFRAGGKAVVNSQPEGFIKVIADNDSHKILGAHIIGHEATELIHEFIIAKRAGLRIEDIYRAVHAHPTFSETAVDACRAVFGKPLHA